MGPGVGPTLHFPHSAGVIFPGCLSRCHARDTSPLLRQGWVGPARQAGAGVRAKLLVCPSSVSPARADHTRHARARHDRQGRLPPYLPDDVRRRPHPTADGSRGHGDPHHAPHRHHCRRARRKLAPAACSTAPRPGGSPRSQPGCMDVRQRGRRYISLGVRLMMGVEGAAPQCARGGAVDEAASVAADLQWQEGPPAAYGHCSKQRGAAVPVGLGAEEVGPYASTLNSQGAGPSVMARGACVVADAPPPPPSEQQQVQQMPTSGGRRQRGATPRSGAGLVDPHPTNKYPPGMRYRGGASPGRGVHTNI